MLHVKRIIFLALALIAVASITVGDDWPQWRGAKRDGVWRETGIVEKFASEQLTPEWRVEIGSGYCGPTIANGRVYVTDRITKHGESERVLCFDEKTGDSIWTYEYACAYGRIGYPAGPRASVTIDSGKAYALGATGRLHVFDAEKGRLLWQKDLDQEYSIEMPVWGIAAAPLIVGDLIILHIGGQRACVVALRKDTGKEAWKALDDRAQYTAPVLIQQAGQPVILCWTGDSVAGLAAKTGEVLWRYPWKPVKMPIGIATPVIEGDRVYFTSFYDGSLMLRLLRDKPNIEKLWQIA